MNSKTRSVEPREIFHVAREDESKTRRSKQAGEKVLVCAPGPGTLAGYEDCEDRYQTHCNDAPTLTASWAESSNTFGTREADTGSDGIMRGSPESKCAHRPVLALEISPVWSHRTTEYGLWKQECRKIFCFISARVRKPFCKIKERE